MAAIQLTELELLSPNPDYLLSNYKWRMKVESAVDLRDAVDVTVVWIGSPNSEGQVLEEVEVGPLVWGLSEFVIEHPGPSWDRILKSEVICISGLSIIFNYRGQEFLRVSYYVDVAYLQEHMTRNPPERPHPSMIGRHILIPKPVVTTKPIEWDGLTYDQ